MRHPRILALPAIALASVAMGPAPKAGKDIDVARFATVKGDATTYNVLSLCSSGKHPEVKADGNKLNIGGQAGSFADGKLTLAKFTPYAK